MRAAKLETTTRSRAETRQATVLTICSVIFLASPNSIMVEKPIIRHWFLAWLLMLPFVVFAAPLIRRLVDLIRHEAHR